MKYIYETVILFLCCVHIVLAQSIPVETSTKTFDLGTVCEGASFQIGRMGEFSCFYANLNSRNCPIVISDPSIEDRSGEIQIDGNGLISSEIWYKFSSDGKHDINVMLYNFRAEKTTTITVTSRSLVKLNIPDGCNTTEHTYINERIWIHTIKVIPKPPTPSLTVERYISPYSVNFIASGCPTNIKETSYEYQWNSTLCLSDINNNYTRNNNPDGTLGGSSNRYYRARCATLNGTCVSDPTAFQNGLTYFPPSIDLIPKDYKESIIAIEEIKKSDRKDYHNYKVETVICQKFEGNASVCNIQTVFRLMLESKQYIAPIASDIPYNGYQSDKRFGTDRGPVNSYQITNLPGLSTDLFLGSDWGDFKPYIKSFISNTILTYIDYLNYSIINYTLPNHSLRPGRVIRQVMEDCDKIKIVTIGEGESWLGDNYLGYKAAQINAEEGKSIFMNVDFRLFLEYDRRYR